MVCAWKLLSIGGYLIIYLTDKHNCAKFQLNNGGNLVDFTICVLMIKLSMLHFITYDKMFLIKYTR